jgi:hypothetical protein
MAPYLGQAIVALHLALPILGILLLGMRVERKRIIEERRKLLRTYIYAAGRGNRRGRRFG